MARTGRYHRKPGNENDDKRTKPGPCEGEGCEVVGRLYAVKNHRHPQIRKRLCVGCMRKEAGL
jgi:hypothetical protein